MSSIIDWYSGSYYMDEYNLLYEAMFLWASEEHDPDEEDMIDIVSGKEKVR